jgi:hypothetical protein
MKKVRSQQTPWKSKASLRHYFENLYSNKLENLEEIDKFLDTYDHIKLSLQAINHPNR